MRCFTLNIDLLKTSVEYVISHILILEMLMSVDHDVFLLSLGVPSFIMLFPNTLLFLKKNCY